MRLKKEFSLLQTIPGIEKILALTIMLEVGDVEAANFATRYSEEARRFFQKKKAKKNGIVAIKALNPMGDPTQDSLDQLDQNNYI